MESECVGQGTFLLDPIVSHTGLPPSVSNKVNLCLPKDSATFLPKAYAAGSVSSTLSKGNDPWLISFLQT